MYRLGWFSTGRGEGSRGLLRAVQEAILRGEIDAVIDFVFCSREPGETEATDTFLKMVADYHIPLVTFSYRKFKAGRPDTDRGEMAPWRRDYDREIMRRLEGYRPDLCLLAGYMLVAGEEMCRRYNLLNLHPAAPWGPAGTYRQVIWRLIELKADESGVMMHLATPALDEGPPVTYCTFAIRGEPFDAYWKQIENVPFPDVRAQGDDNALFREIRRHGYARETPLIMATIRSFRRGEVSITPDKRVVDATGKAISGYDLTAEIDRQLKGAL